MIQTGLELGCRTVCLATSRGDGWPFSETQLPCLLVQVLGRTPGYTQVPLLGRGGAAPLWTGAGPLGVAPRWPPLSVVGTMAKGTATPPRPSQALLHPPSPFSSPPRCPVAPRLPPPGCGQLQAGQGGSTFLAPLGLSQHHPWQLGAEPGSGTPSLVGPPTKVTVGPTLSHCPQGHWPEVPG